MPVEKPVDLRSDTVTQPTPAMKEAMMCAPLGDDVFGDDPSVLNLERRVADLFGKEAAVFVPSGTMANQISIRAHSEPGDEIICHRTSHIYQYEGGGPMALSGCSIMLLEGDRGMFSGRDVLSAIRPVNDHFPRAKLVVVENTQNRGGGAVWPLDKIADVAGAAREANLKMHLDGARIMNACVASGVAADAFARDFDSATICFSKGLGAPVGSAVAGTSAFIARARRFRKMFGGAMRQSGMLAAAADYALDHHVDRLADDHANAKRLAEGLAQIKGLTVVTPETNIVYFDIEGPQGIATKIATTAEQHNVRVIAISPNRLRAVTHLHITPNDIHRAIEGLGLAIEAVTH